MVQVMPKVIVFIVCVVLVKFCSVTKMSKTTQTTAYQVIEER